MSKNIFDTNETNADSRYCCGIYSLLFCVADAQQFASGAGYTILPYDPLYLKVIGQQVEWSFLDTKAINSLYCNGLYRETYDVLVDCAAIFFLSQV